MLVDLTELEIREIKIALGYRDIQIIENKKPDWWSESDRIEKINNKFELVLREEQSKKWYY